MMKIKQQFVLQHVINKRTSGTGNPCRYITIHETDNESMGAGAQAHADLQSRLNPREASWHYSVDDKETIQSFPDNIRCWHAGDGKGKGNMESIGIEICVNRDSDYKKAVLNAADLTRYLMEKYNIPIQNVRQHYDWSRKNCPRSLRNGSKGYTWNDFKNLVTAEKPASGKTYKVNTTLDGYITAADAKAGKNKKTTVSAGTYYIYKEHGGMLNVTKKEGVAGSWINPGKNTAPSKPKKDTFLIRVKAKELWYYDRPDWNAKKDTVKRDEVFTVIDTLYVNGSKMYKLKSGTYITANTQYVEKV